MNRKSGVYILISHGFPDDRLPYLVQKEYDWGVYVYKIYKPDIVTYSYEFDAKDLNNYHFIYVCRTGHWHIHEEKNKNKYWSLYFCFIYS